MKEYSPGLILVSLLIAAFACQAGSDGSPPAETVTGTQTTVVTPRPIATRDATTTAETVPPTETATVPKFVALDLNVAGYTADQGALVWMQSEELTVLSDAAYPDNVVSQALEPEVTAANFVFSTDLEWDSELVHGSYNYFACGVIFRAEDVEHGEQAHFNAIFINPAAFPAWEIELWNSGQFQSTISDFHLGPAIQGAGSTNHFLIVADGSTITVFANGFRLDSVTLKASLPGGKIGVLARAALLVDPDITSCIFTNTWVWELP